MSVSSIYKIVPEYIKFAITDGYKYECSCGELYNTIENASRCQKCTDTEIGFCASVIDITNDKEVWDKQPGVESVSFEISNRAGIDTPFTLGDLCPNLELLVD